ncbi:uncharacterized protein LOC115624775 [Scaptodrosophila lebanonensis]|uniref:Uncharacterized protein LOC115624775 n=1 Tax=Drosophila lebanonensis TaxID=7225 RepID=A0A6J2TKC5_DROLE|nr:uncharacterized protein LOC115624775 [Scaptodrosophila lebanonensis]
MWCISKLLSSGSILLIFLSLFSPGSSSSRNSRNRLISYAQHNIATISSNAVAQANEIVEHMLEDLRVLNSHNTFVLGYQQRLIEFNAQAKYSNRIGNETDSTLNAFYDIVGVYLNADVPEKPIEVLLIEFCFQRNGLDRWKRTVHMRIGQLLKIIGDKLELFMDTLDSKEVREVIKQRWQSVKARGGQRKLNRLHEFLEWFHGLELEN